eukprot:1375719-Rhodomonas_salina.2
MEGTVSRSRTCADHWSNCDLKARTHQVGLSRHRCHQQNDDRGEDDDGKLEKDAPEEEAEAGLKQPRGVGW